MSSKAVAAMAAGAIALSGCSSKPRNFAPVLAVAPSDGRLYETRWIDCREQAAAALKSGHARAASAAGGAVAGAGGAAAVGAATAGTYATMGGAMAALGATIVAAPIAAVVGAWGISKIKKTKKERAIKAATAECLERAGYSVDRWRVMSKQEVRALPTVPPAEAAPAVPQAGGDQGASSETPASEPK